MTIERKLPKRKLPPVGTFEATITDIEEPRKSKSRDYMFFIPMKIRIEKRRQKEFMTLGLAHPMMTLFLWDMRSELIGRKIKVKVKHVIHGEVTYPSIGIVRDAKLPKTWGS